MPRQALLEAGTHIRQDAGQNAGIPKALSSRLRAVRAVGRTCRRREREHHPRRADVAVFRSPDCTTCNNMRGSVHPPTSGQPDPAPMLLVLVCSMYTVGDVPTALARPAGHLLLPESGQLPSLLYHPATPGRRGSAGRLHG